MVHHECLIFHQPSTTVDPKCGSTHLKTSCLSSSCHCPVLYYNHLVRKHLLACRIQATQHHSMTSHLTILTVLERKPACCKQPRSDLVASHQDRRSPSLWSQIEFHHSRTSQQSSYSNRQAKKYLRKASFISLTRGLSVMGFVYINDESACRMHHLFFSTLTDYN